MRLLTTGLLLASLFTLAAPREVEAQGKREWWGWLERLSGPGPFNPVFDEKFAMEIDRLICGSAGQVGSAFSGGNLGNLFQSDKKVKCSVFDAPRWFLSFHVSSLTNEDIEEQPDDWGPTDLTRALFMFYVSPLPKTSPPVLHLGAGAGVYYFDGKGSGARRGEPYKAYHAAIPVRVRVTPFAFFSKSMATNAAVPASKRNRILTNLSRSVYWEGGFDFVPGPIEADQFKSSATYHKRNEWGWTDRFVVNLSTLLLGF